MAQPALDERMSSVEPAPKSTRRRALRASARGKPPVDERLVMPETRFEIIEGEVSYVVPADEPHAVVHSKLAAVLEAHAAPAYMTAVDMLTRTSKHGDMAPDASVYPRARNPKTGGRKLEELAFEVVSKQTLSHAAKKARALASRGVRRILAIDVEGRAALEWSSAEGDWAPIHDDAITDPALVVPLPVAALTDAAAADNAVAHALLAKRHPIIEGALAAREAHGEARGEARGKERGTLKGKRKALMLVLDARGIPLSKKDKKRIDGEDKSAVLDAWIRRATTCARAADLFRT